MARFEGKRVIVTGGARGIGKAIAERFAAEGARLLLTDRRADLLRETARDLSQQYGVEVLTFTMDVSQKAGVDGMMAFQRATWGGVDVLVNNAGIAEKVPFLELPEDVWDETIAVNLKGVFMVGQAVARDMVAARAGVIVNMCSTNGLVGEVECAHYNASKAGVLLLTKSMALELAPFGIRVNCVAPGFILTDLSQACLDEATRNEYSHDLVPMQRFGMPEEVAGVIAFLASSDASFVTGECIVIDGGQLSQ
jgi:NAD(P)-dependent dehydrogenase (short-subunit alcohol dehydrogenase family)